MKWIQNRKMQTSSIFSEAIAHTRYPIATDIISEMDEETLRDPPGDPQGQKARPQPTIFLLSYFLLFWDTVKLGYNELPVITNIFCRPKLFVISEFHCSLNLFVRNCLNLMVTGVLKHYLIKERQFSKWDFLTWYKFQRDLLWPHFHNSNSNKQYRHIIK